MKRLGWGLFLAVLSLWLFEALDLLQSELRFTADSERDLLQVFGLSHAGIMPESGILMAALGWDLGPLYFLLLTPINWLWSSPQAVHLFNVAICTGGLFAAFLWMRTQYGVTAALVATLLYTQSAAHWAFVDTIWHVGATPGVALAMLASAGWWFKSGRNIALVCCTALALFLVQLHALGMTYLPALLMLLILGRAHMNKKAWILFGVTALIVALPMLLYLIPSLGQTGGSAARHSGGLAFRPAAFLEGLGALLQPKYLLAPGWGGMTMEVLAVVGMVSVIREFIAGQRAWFEASLIAQLILGAVIVSLVVPYEMVGRYFLPVIFPIVFLVARGVVAVDQWLISRNRNAKGRAFTWIAVFVGLSLVGPLQQGQLSAQTGTQELDYLTASEQEAAVNYLMNEKGLDWLRLRNRVHGTFFGPLSGIRYLTRAKQPKSARGTQSGASSHFLVRTQKEQTDTDSSASTTTIETGHRTLVIEEFAAHFDAKKVLGENGPCSFPFPYLWSESRTELLVALGFSLGHGPDVHRCFKDGKGGTLVIPLGPRAVTLSVEISDDGHFQGVQAERVQAVLKTPGFPDFPLQPEHSSGMEKERYSMFIPKHDGVRELVLALRPQGNLSFLDVY